MNEVIMPDTENENENVNTGTFDPDNFLSADINVEESGFGSQFPLCQWVNGDPTKKQIGGIAYTGGFFISADSGIECPPGFEPVTLYTKENEELKGFGARDLKGAAVIRYRRAWTADPGEGGLVRRYGWNDYDGASLYGKARGVAHVLIGLRGFEEPILVSWRGLTCQAVMGMGKDRGVIPTFGAVIGGAAKRIARKNKRSKQYPLCAFRMDIGPARDDKGDPVFTQVGSGSNTSMVTFPVWLDATSGEVSEAEVQRRFVGGEDFATYQDIHKEADEWVHSWDPEALAARNQRLDKTSITVASPSDVPGEHAAPF